MTTSNEQPAALAVQETKALSPMDMIQRAFEKALDQGAALEVIDRILSQQKSMIEYQDKVTFNDALARVQANVRRIAADAENDQTHSRYATFAALDSVIRPIYIAEGLALSFNTADVEKADMVRVVCDVSLGGYTRQYHIDMPADGKGARGGDVMTRTHATGSAVSYGKRYLLIMIFNLTVGAEMDDDGNKAAGGSLAETDFLTLKDNIENSNTINEVTRFYLAAIKAAGIVGDKTAIEKFEKIAKDRREAIKR